MEREPDVVPRIEVQTTVHVVAEGSFAFSATLRPVSAPVEHPAPRPFLVPIETGAIPQGLTVNYS
jgi:hypothetical protein